jgi:hypothetical protein
MFIGLNYLLHKLACFETPKQNRCWRPEMRVKLTSANLNAINT